jgi:hypothetical protein
VKVAIHQPHYWPWTPYISKVLNADRFVLLDDVQFEKNGYQHRAMMPNGKPRLGTERSWDWMSLPVSHKSNQLIREAHLADGWQEVVEKHRVTIEQRYSKSPGWEMWSGEILKMYKWIEMETRLMEVCNVTLYWLLSKLGWNGSRMFSSQMRQTGLKGSARIADLCGQTGATTYLSGPGGRDYLDLADFKHIGCEVVFQEWDGGYEWTALDLVMNSPLVSAAAIKASSTFGRMA